MDVYFCKKSSRTSLCPLRYKLIITAKYNAHHIRNVTVLQKQIHRRVYIILYLHEKQSTVTMPRHNKLLFGNIMVTSEMQHVDVTRNSIIIDF